MSDTTSGKESIQSAIAGRTKNPKLIGDIVSILGALYPVLQLDHNKHAAAELSGVEGQLRNGPQQMRACTIRALSAFTRITDVGERIQVSA